VANDPKDQKELSEEEWNEEQARQAESQSTGPSPQTVPERRPIASQQADTSPSELTQRLKDEGSLSVAPDEPMGKDAYDRAESDSQAKKAAKASGSGPRAHIGTVVDVLDGPHRGRRGAVTRIVSYESAEDRLYGTSGEPALQDYTEPKEVEVTFRGDDRDGERAILDLKETEYQVNLRGFTGRGAVMGGIS
jgi:hypothetical protein